MNTTQSTYLMFWWHYNCVTSHVTKFYFMELLFRTELSNWRPAGRIRPATPSNPARDHPPENVVHRPVMYCFSMPVCRLTIIHAFTTYLFFSVDLTYRVDVISQLTNLCTGIRSQPPPISRHLGAFFYGTRFIWSTMYRSTILLRFIWSICPGN